MGWEEFGRLQGGTVKPLADPNAIQAGETVYHIPTWAARGKQPSGPSPSPSPHTRDPGPSPPAGDQPTGRPYLIFDGKRLDWIAGDGTTTVSLSAVSGLRPNHKKVKEGIASGRLKPGVDYTTPRYQDLEGVGPIPAGDYYVDFTRGAPFEKTPDDGAGWGVGGWRLRPTSRTARWLERIDGGWWDLPGVRSGFFLHNDGGNDGTAGCVGVINGADVLWLQKEFSKLFDAGQSRVIVRVRY